MIQCDEGMESTGYDTFVYRNNASIIAMPIIWRILNRAAVRFPYIDLLRYLMRISSIDKRSYRDSRKRRRQHSSLPSNSTVFLECNKEQLHPQLGLIGGVVSQLLHHLSSIDTGKYAVKRKWVGSSRMLAFWHSGQHQTTQSQVKATAQCTLEETGRWTGTIVHYKCNITSVSSYKLSVDEELNQAIISRKRIVRKNPLIFGRSAAIYTRNMCKGIFMEPCKSMPF